MQPLPLSCIPLTIQQHFQRLFKHNKIYFSVLVKIYEGLKYIPAGNYSPLENAFTEGWNLIRKQSGGSQREPASPSVFPMFTSPQFGNTMFFNLQKPTFVLQYMIQWNILSRSIALDLKHIGLDWTGQCFPAILPTEKLSIATYPQLLSDLLEATNSSYFSLYDTTTLTQID